MTAGLPCGCQWQTDMTVLANEPPLWSVPETKGTLICGANASRANDANKGPVSGFVG